jgi:hypothetical protein
MLASEWLFVEQGSWAGWKVEERKADNVLVWNRKRLIGYSHLQRGQHDEARYILLESSGDVLIAVSGPLYHPCRLLFGGVDGCPISNPGCGA